MFLSSPGRRHRRPPVTRSVLERRLEDRLREASLYLNERLSAVSRRRLRLVLLVSTAAWGAACVAITCHGLGDTQKVPASASRLSRPVVRNGGLPPDSGLTRAKARLARTRDYLDSVREQDPERYDHLREARPALFDSLNQIQDILSR